MAMISEYYENLKDQLLNDLSISFQEADYELLANFLDFGFKVVITRGTIFLDSDSYKQALSNMIYNIVDDLSHEGYSTVKEYRFDYDKTSMIDEIYLHYLNDYETKTLGEVVEDLQSDWVPTSEEIAKEKADMSDVHETQRHPDEKNFGSPLNKGKKLFVRGDELL